MSNEAAQLPELISKPYAYKVGKSVVLDKILTRMHGSVDGKIKPLSLEKACAESGVTYQEIQQWMMDDPELKERWKLALDTAKENAKMKARSNAYDALSGKLELNDKELADYSLKFLQLTDDDFNPAQKIDKRSASINFDISTEQILEELKKIHANNPQ